MDSNRSSSIPSSSTTTISQQNISNSLTKSKLLIGINFTGKILGDAAARFSTRIGELIRIHIPISYKEWGLVPYNFKHDVWNILMGEFSLDIGPIVFRRTIKVALPPFYRRFKYELRLACRIKALREEQEVSEEE
ncbi:hypothetical protein MKX01_036484, partial [Papaver californicum]